MSKVRAQVSGTPIFDKQFDIYEGAEEFIDSDEVIIRKDGKTERPFAHQRECFLACIDGLSRGLTSFTYVQFTGTGKTHVFSYLDKYLSTRLGWNGLALAHLGELLNQAQKRLKSFGVESAVEKSGMDAREEIATERNLSGRTIKTVLGSRQTMVGKRLMSWPRNYFQWLWVDECHRVMSKQNLNIIGHFNEAVVIGATATDYRNDKKDIYDIFQERVYEYPAWKAWDDGMICRPIQRKPNDFRIDLSGITIKRTENGMDLDAEALSDRIMQNLTPIANAIVEQVGPDRKTLIFVPNVKVAYALAKMLVPMGIDARAVDGDNPDRATIADDFRANKFRCLINVALYTDGYDCPDIDAIVLARATTSKGLLVQMVGRGLRIGKPDCIILDFQWLIDDYDDIASLADVFARPGHRPDGIALARKMMDDGVTDNPIQALQDAEIELRSNQEEEEEKIRRRRDEMKVQGRLDPTGVKFVDSDVLKRPAKAIPTTKIKAYRAPNAPGATAKQASALESLGVSPKLIDIMSPGQAGMVMTNLIQRRNMGLARYEQVEKIVSGGMDRKTADSLTVKQASEMLYEMKKWDRGMSTGSDGR